MKIFRTNSFNFYTFNIEEEEHQRFLYALLKDKDTKRFLTNIDSFLEEENSDFLDSSYVVGNDDKIVGYISLFKEFNINDYKGVSYNYAIHPEFRHHGLGSRLLTETSDYLFARFKFIKFIELLISDHNFNSINAAKKAGFINDEGMLYHKYREL